MKKVTLKGLNKRGKDRVNNYGSEFMMAEAKDNRFGKNFRFFESIRKSFSMGTNSPVEWSGWLELGVEVEIVE